jgi:MFS family permease
VVACLGVSLVISSMVALNAAPPDLARETSATQTQLTWVVDGYILALACMLLPAGAIGDRYGRRGTLLVGLAIFSTARREHRNRILHGANDFSNHGSSSR